MGTKIICASCVVPFIRMMEPSLQKVVLCVKIYRCTFPMQEIDDYRLMFGYLISYVWRAFDYSPGKYVCCKFDINGSLIIVSNSSSRKPIHVIAISSTWAFSIPNHLFSNYVLFSIWAVNCLHLWLIMLLFFYSVNILTIIYKLLVYKLCI